MARLVPACKAILVYCDIIVKLVMPSPVDIDECSVNNGGCGDLICTNTPGSFECGCPPGLTVATDGITCTG